MTSEKELKIRKELEKEIEKSMEVEIKDGICQLVLRLHRLYQHMEGLGGANTLRPEVCNISIRLEGGISRGKMEIKEIKREALVTSSDHKKFDWEKSLRRSSCGGAYSAATTTGSGQGVKKGRRRESLDRDVKVPKSGWKY